MGKESYGGGCGTTKAYTVEVRTTYPGAEIHVDGYVIETVWRRVPYRLSKCDRSDHNHYQSGNVGEIPVWNYNFVADECGLLSYNAAYALAVQVQARLWNGGCVETRIVEVEIKYNFETRRVAAGETISLSDLRRAEKFKNVEAPEPTTAG